MRGHGVLSFAAAFAIASCATVQTTGPGAVGVERGQFMLVSSDEVDAVAAQQYQDLIQEAGRQGALDRDGQLAERVRSITSRLVAQTGAFRPDARGWQWETHVLTADQANAWCMPGGKIVVYTGLPERFRLTDDELAAVLGHEMAHALREHGREQMSEQLATGLVLDVAFAALRLDERRSLLARLVVNVTFSLPHSRVQEQEADRIGVELAARAGFDPHGAVNLWYKMARMDGGSTPEFLSTHPSTASRIEDLQAYSEVVAPLYQLAIRAEQPPTATVAAAAVPSTPQVAYVTAGSQPLATIFVNDGRVPSNPLLDYAVPAGPVRLRFEVRDAIGTWSEEMTVNLSPGEHRNLGRLSLNRAVPSAAVTVAYLTVGTLPLATIFVNDHRAPSDPIVNYVVPAGPVRLRFVVPDSSGTWTQQITITLAPGEHRNLGRLQLVRE